MSNHSDTSLGGYAISGCLTLVGWGAVIYFIILESQGKVPFAGMILAVITFGLVGCAGIFFVYRQLTKNGRQ